MATTISFGPCQAHGMAVRNGYQRDELLFAVQYVEHGVPRGTALVTRREMDADRPVLIQNGRMQLPLMAQDDGLLLAGYGLTSVLPHRWKKHHGERECAGNSGLDGPEHCRW
jgi:hypothetical protein